MTILLKLSSFAAAPTRSSLKLHDQPIEIARTIAKVKASNRTKGNMWTIGLRFGKGCLKLNAIQADATRLYVPTDKVEKVTEQLNRLIETGVFDEEIKAEQLRLRKLNSLKQLNIKK
ncbi:hypothetical protein MK852_23780 [Shewanella benthica]|uniref:hypothetical protein n=1 Tax=Shewanella benthica TaxID=43661 RepID=UPI001879712F|nr:hypothetical protein [Shewanella benthica]MBE7216383.1 hypothetical protein [Shewanella benthica]MCL1065115.1 hypothetical protein [Shewanella benthica]